MQWVIHQLQLLGTLIQPLSFSSPHPYMQHHPPIYFSYVEQTKKLDKCSPTQVLETKQANLPLLEVSTTFKRPQYPNASCLSLVVEFTATFTGAVGEGAPERLKELGSNPGSGADEPREPLSSALASVGGKNPPSLPSSRDTSMMDQKFK